jgi:hypothetical protein
VKPRSITPAELPDFVEPMQAKLVNSILPGDWRWGARIADVMWQYQRGAEVVLKPAVLSIVNGFSDRSAAFNVGPEHYLHETVINSGDLLNLGGC